MSSAVSLTVFSMVWLTLLLLDRLFRWTRLKSYCKLASRVHLRVGFFNLKLFISKSELAGVKRLLSNSCFCKFMLDVWFSMGVLASLFALSSTPSSSASTLSSAEQNFLQSNSVDARTMMVPVIPGFNLPWTRLPMLLGHALAATGEGVPVLGFGFFLFGFYPGAFTELTGRDLDGLTTWRKLKVFSAGVWHNVVLAAVGSVCSGAVLQLARRLHGSELDGGVWVRSPAFVEFTTTSGEVPLFAAGTVIRSVNGCEVLNRADWSRCLFQAAEPDQADNHYYCLPHTEHVPEMVDDLRQFFGCVRSFSLTLALLNAVPCYGLDGQFILRALTACRAGCSPLRRLLTELCICLCTALLLFCLLLSALAYLMQSLVDCNPTPVFCVKTRQLDRDGQPSEKLFINFCTCTLLPCPEMITEAELVSILESDNPGRYRVAISISQREPVLDHSGRPSSALAVLFNDQFHRRRTATSDLFRTFLICVALDEIQSKHGITLDRDNWLQLKHRKHVGPIDGVVPSPMPTSTPAPVHTVDHGEHCGRQGRPLSVNLPKPWFQICKDSADQPTKLLAKFRLSGVRRGRQVQLALSDRRLVLLVLGKYAFDEILPCAFDPDQADAQFDTEKQTLTLQLPLKADLA
ncbi:PIH1 domain-containing protein 1 [Trichinella pseudospiralis]|uniref:Membrane-bound transcription factor site-2 protease n=1 Tax=Trichinella pseudospiralis TaxID=6337 RepID=A0A0V0Y0G8_TRIPS|nr:PIH1 domain-containing protein 1 [Trichinella pseudospiralis]